MPSPKSCANLSATRDCRGTFHRSKRARWFTSLLIWLGAGLAGAADVSPSEKMLWSSYMICWPLNRDYHGFYDRPLDRPPRDGSPSRLVDLRRATEAGVDALSVDLFIADKHALGAFGELVKLINEQHLPIRLSPMFDGLADPGLSLDEVAAKIEQWFQRFAGEPCVVRTGGKPVIFTYGATGLDPAQWESMWRRLRAAGCEGYWIGELSHYLSVGESPDFARAKPWIDRFPAINSFNVHSGSRAEDLIRGCHRRAGSAPVWVAPVSMGYWRPEIAVHTSQRGTELFRETWQAIVDGGVCWVQQSTWNDFSENHQLMPSENRGTVFVELNRYLAQQWKGRPEEPGRPRFFLSQPQEVLVGEDASWELLAILPRRSVPATAALRVLDADGHCLQAFPEMRIAKPGLQATTLKFPVRERPPGRLLVGEASLLDSTGKVLAHIQSPFTVVAATGYHPERNFSCLHTSAPESASPLSCRLEFPKAGEPEALVRVESAGELSDVEVLKNGCQWISLRRDSPEKPLVSPLVWEGKLPVNRKGTLDWGWYTARAVTADGRTTTSRPVLIDRPPEADTTLGDWRFDADSETDVLDQSPWLHDGRLGGRPRRKPWFPAHAADPWGGKCLHFDGVDDRVLLEGPIVPPDAFTVECWIRPASDPVAAEADKSGQILFATANAAVVLSLDRNDHLQVTRKSNGRWHSAGDRMPVVLGEWQHVAVTYDGATLRLYRKGGLAGEVAVSGRVACGQVAVGYNSVTDRGFYAGLLDELRLSARALRPEEFGPHSPLGNPVLHENPGDKTSTPLRGNEGHVETRVR